MALLSTGRARKIAQGPLNQLEELGDQLSLYVRAIAWIPATVTRYGKEILRLLAEVSFGSGALIVILGTLIWNGVAGLSLDVFTTDTPPPGSAGGLANAIVGSIILTTFGVVIGTPIGILAGTYMA